MGPRRAALVCFPGQGEEESERRTVDKSERGEGRLVAQGRRQLSCGTMVFPLWDARLPQRWWWCNMASGLHICTLHSALCTLQASDMAGDELSMIHIHLPHAGSPAPPHFPFSAHVHAAALHALKGNNQGAAEAIRNPYLRPTRRNARSRQRPGPCPRTCTCTLQQQAGRAELRRGAAARA